MDEDISGRNHRAPSRGQFRAGQASVPESSLREGRFGRMFRNLPSYEPTDQLIQKLVDQMVESEGSPDHDSLPAGITYLGQFIDHDLTFDPTSSLERQNDPDALRNFRTPGFDLDCVYGTGPADQPYLYQAGDRAKFLIGGGEGTDTLAGPDGDRRAEDDLPRNVDELALIGDPRNDENIIVSQLQLAFLKFHNRLVDDVRADGNGAVDLRPHLWSRDDPFQEAQRLARWHYQWIVLTEFLPAICDGSVLAELVEETDVGGGQTCRRLLEGAFYRPKVSPYIPVEWSVGAYRFGHSLIRPVYHLNETLRGFRDGRPVDIFIEDPTPDKRLQHLAGSRQLPPFWTLDWRMFFRQQGSDGLLQLARRIDTLLADGLRFLPGIENAPRFLAERNLRRGRSMGLPSGQAVARRLCVEPLTRDELGFDVEAPLWYYVLREAELRAGGQRLGPVGSTIVAETMLGILRADPFSFVRTDPSWQPVLPRESGEASQAWGIADLLRYAVPTDGRSLQPPGPQPPQPPPDVSSW